MVKDIGRLLVVNAHPDDVEFYCGGFLSRLIAAGTEVRYICCTDGSRGTMDRSLSPSQLAAVRERELQAAAKELGVKSVRILPRPDFGALDVVELRSQVIAEIRNYLPDALLTHDAWKPYLVHPDHHLVGLSACQAAAAAAFPHIHPEAPYGEVPRLSKVFLFDTEDPNLFVDIEEQLEMKTALLRHYPSQLEQAGAHDRRLHESVGTNAEIGMRLMADAIICNARQAGETAGLNYAEAYRWFAVLNGHFGDREPLIIIPRGNEF